MSSKNIALTAITVCFTFLVTLVLGEICIRLFAIPHGIPAPPPHSSFNPYMKNGYVMKMRPYGHFYIPGAQYAQKFAHYTNEYSINSMGFRGENFTSKPLQDKHRLAVIGDSIVEGHGVMLDQTFTYHLQDKLTESGWEVVNLGVQGASPFYFAANLERYLYLNPDAVLLLINENDLYDDEIREQLYFSLPILENREILYSGGALRSWLFKSRLFSFLKITLQEFSKSPLEKIIQQNAKNHDMGKDGQKSSKSKSSFLVPPSKIDKRWEMSQQYLTYFLDTLRSQNIDLLVATSCSVTLAFPEIQEYVTHCSNLVTRVEQWADKYSVPYLSLVPSMQKALQEYKRNDVLIFNDYHPTSLAHSLFAAELYPFVSNSLVEKTNPKHVPE